MSVSLPLAEEYADGILHATTRQDIQLHFVHIDDTPDLMRRLGAVGITTKEACGNSVRNVTSCPRSGTCSDEPFDVTPYADACAQFLLGHEDTQDFGRKFKIAFSGCGGNACALTSIHDLGFIAQVRTNAKGSTERGFRCVVGGGLGAVPYQAKVLYEFLPETEILPVSQAIGRVFARLGEKRNRARARIKFVIAKVGIESFLELVEQERKTLPEDPRWTAFLGDLSAKEPAKPGTDAIPASSDETFQQWIRTNTAPQRQKGYYRATITLPLGDLTAHQARGLADIARKWSADDMRITVDQNIVLRWIAAANVEPLFQALGAIELAQAGAGTICDVTALPRD